MAPKQKKKRSKDGSESDSAAIGFSVEKEDHAFAVSLSSTRTTRASARACNAKNRSDMLMEAALAAQAEQVHKACDFVFEDLIADAKYKYNSKEHEKQLLRRMDAREFTMEYYHQTGLNEVLVFSCNPEALGMKMVDDNFTVDDVLRIIGKDRMITCVKVDTQGSEDMSLMKFIDYYKQKEKPELFNVLSLEFSNTELSDLVQSPSLVRKIDWASSWPDERKNRTITFDKDGTFTVTHNYPRVENYCLMSPNTCYTDFHIDFHGTSVWYHVKKGKKIFWIIEPTDNNLFLYEEYLKAADNKTFFGDVVTQCELVEVMPGNTLIIPSGWIHSVFTPQDSLVFGGNFLHSRQAKMQLKVLASENRIKINKKYRYPQSEETVFFYISDVVRKVTQRQYIRPESRNQQNGYKEYCGILFREKMLHHRIPTEKDYADDGVVWDEKWNETEDYEISVNRLAEFDGKKEEKVVLDANGLEEEANEEDGSMPILSPKKDIKVSETSDEEKEKQRRERDEKKIMEEMAKRNMPGGHDDFFMDPIFYHPRSFNLDGGVGAAVMHTLPLSKNEPPLYMDEDALRREIHPRAIPELEALVVYFLNKTRVDLPHGLTRPNSLLQCFMKVLRERRWMAETDEEYRDLEPSILPDDDESRRIHEAKKEEGIKRQADRKRKMEKRKAIEDGEEGESDTDWNPDEEKPKTKKGKKSGDGGGKMVAPTGQGKKKGGPSPPSHSRPHLLSSALYTARLMSRPFFPTPSTSKSIYSMDLDVNGGMGTDPSSSSSSRAMATDNGSSEGGMVKRCGQKKETGSRPASIVGVLTKDGNELSKTMKEDSIGMGEKKIMGERCISDKQPQSEVAKRLMWAEKNTNKEAEKAHRLYMKKSQPSVNAPVRISTPSAEALRNSMQQKLGFSTGDGSSKSRLSGTQSGGISNEVSLSIVSYLLKRDPRFPQFSDFPFPPVPLAEQVRPKMEWLKDNINGDSKKEFTTDQLVLHIIMLKYHALTGVRNTTEAVEFLESIEKVARELLEAKKVISNRALINHSTPSTSLISVKPVNEASSNPAVVLMAQSLLKALIPVEKKEKIEGSCVIGVKPPVYPPHSIVNIISGIDDEKMEKEEEKDKKKKDEGDDKGEAENGRNTLENESDFRETRREPKPPEGGETEEGMGGKGSDLASSSHYGSVSPTQSQTSSTTTMKIDKGRMRDKETPIKRREPAIIGMEIDPNEPSTIRSGVLKEAKKKKKEEMARMVSPNGASSQRNSREELKGHSRWLAKKNAQQNVIVKRYTDSPDDWTPFDVFLKKNYQFLCYSYNEKPSNALALDIKRNLWSNMIGGKGTTRWEMEAAKLRADRKKRIYWRSETVVEQEDRVVVDKGLNVIPLGGEEIGQGIESESIEHRPVIANGDEYLADEGDAIDDIMVDVEGVEDEILMEPEETECVDRGVVLAVKEEGKEPSKKKGKGGRPKKEPVMSEKKRKAPKGDNEDFMQTGTTPRGKGKKVKPDPNKPLIVDGVPVNPLAEPAVKNAYGYDPAMDIVPLGQGQLKSAYRRSKAQLDTPQIDAKRYKLEVKHDHLLDDDDHDDTHREDSETMTAYPRPTTPHGGAEVMEGINVHIGDDSTRCVSPSGGSSEQQQFHPSHQAQKSPAPSFIQNQRSGSFSRRMHQSGPSAAPPLIPHAPSPLSARRISGGTTDGWGGMSGGARRRSDGGDRRDSTPGNRSPTRKSSQFLPGDGLPLTPSTPTSIAAAAAKQTRLSQAEQFTMAAPKVIDAPRLATPIVQSQSSSDSSLVSRSLSFNEDEPLPVDVFCAQLERITADLERANAILASTSTNGN